MSTVPIASLFAEVVVVAEPTATASAASSEAAASAASAVATAAATATARTTAAASSRTATATTTTATRLTLFGDVHSDSATVEALTVHLLHRGLGRVSFGERHEAKASGTARLSVGDHLGFDDFSKRRESIA